MTVVQPLVTWVEEESGWGGGEVGWGGDGSCEGTEDERSSSEHSAKVQYIQKVECYSTAFVH